MFKTSDAGVRKPPEALKKMRAAGRVVAEMHADIREAIRPGRHDRRARPVARAVLDRRGARSNFLGYGHPPFPGGDLRLAERRDRARHPRVVPARRRATSSPSTAGRSSTAGTATPPSPRRSARSTPRPSGSSTWPSPPSTPPSPPWSTAAGSPTSATPCRRVAEAGGFSVVREYVGHGIGTSMHEPPDVKNYGDPGKGMKLRPGMVFAVEPMLNAGRTETTAPGRRLDGEDRRRRRSRPTSSTPSASPRTAPRSSPSRRLRGRPT